MTLAWHFTTDKLRDGRDIPPVGETLRHDGDLAMCKSGLHASVRAIDALYYAPGNIVHRVRCGGEILASGDKLVCRERTILWSADAESTLRHFARLCALDVIHLWDAPQVVRDYLETGDGSMRAAAWGAARAAARGAARDAARDAARGAARDAARDAARGAAWGAARSAAWDAARDAARGAAWGAVRGAAWDAARDAQNIRLSEMLMDLAPAAAQEESDG